MKLRWVNKTQNKERRFFLICDENRRSYGCLWYDKPSKQWLFTSPLFCAYGTHFKIECDTDNVWRAQTAAICEVKNYLEDLLKPFDMTEEEYRDDRDSRLKPPMEGFEPVFRDEDGVELHA